MGSCKVVGGCKVEGGCKVGSTAVNNGQAALECSGMHILD